MGAGQGISGRDVHVVDRVLAQHGEIKLMKLLQVVFCLAAGLSGVYCQGSNCTETNLTNEFVSGLLSRSLARHVGDEAIEGQAPSVTVLDQNTVCLATDLKDGTYRYVSLVVRYNCEGAACPTGKLKSDGFSRD